jgi:hypothetical protein
MYALKLDPDPSDARDRLGIDYDHMGQRDRAEAEFSVYRKLRAQHSAAVDKEKADVEQFVYSSKAAFVTKP